MKKWLTLLFIIGCQGALAQTKPAPSQRVWITEFSSNPVQVTATPIAQLPALVKHPPLDLSSGLPQTATLNAKTRYFRIICEVQCAFSTTGDATTNDILLARIVPEYFAIAGGSNISVIAAP